MTISSHNLQFCFIFLYNCKIYNSLNETKVERMKKNEIAQSLLSHYKDGNDDDQSPKF